VVEVAVEAIRKRRSIRKYEDTPVSDDQVKQVVETLLYAPSWANKMGWQVLVVKDAATREKLSAAIEGNPGARAVAQAPVLIAVCMDPAASGSLPGREYFMVDAGILMDHLMLEAADLGLGTVFIGMFDEDKVREVLGVPAEFKIVGLTPLGVPAKIPGERPRADLDQVVHWEKW
jgi:nitroreductase